MKTRNVAVIAMLAGIGLGAIAVQVIHAQATPPAFLIFDAEIKDAAAYQPFLQTAVRQIQLQGGKFLVAGATPEALSGKPSSNRISISQWVNKEDIRRWFNSDAMKPVREAQEKYTSTRLYILGGGAPQNRM
jgi:uncharacterized protein (DUF1330 family)